MRAAKQRALSPTLVASKEPKGCGLERGGAEFGQGSGRLPQGA